MATATVTSSSAATADSHLNHLHTESLPLIDLRLLSQSELLSLSLCSSSSSLHYLQNDADLSTPKIDRSVFNESAGSRKQTFSRLRLAPRNHNSQFCPSTPVPHCTSAEQVLDEDNSQIVSLLKSLFCANSDETAGNCDKNADRNLVSVPIQYNEFLGFPSSRNEALQNNAVTVSGGGDYSGGEMEIREAIPDSATKKRKRGRPRKNKSNIYGNNVNDNLNQMMEIEENKEIERKTIAVDGDVEEKGKEAMALGSMEDPYEEELRRRTAGMHTKEELVGFLEGLGGEWLSKRKKKKIVDASMVGIGNVLPSGWKLTLCIKKKAGYFWIACRRYIRFYF